MINANTILAAAFIYKKNRDAQATLPWNKQSDAQLLMKQMSSEGLKGVHGMASSYFGTTENGKLFVVDIGEKDVTIGEFEDFEAMMDSWRK